MKFTKYHRRRALVKRCRAMIKAFIQRCEQDLTLAEELEPGTGEMFSLLQRRTVNFTATPDPANFNAVFGKFGINPEQENPLDQNR